MLVSVILPLYNGEEYLDFAIKSILSQTHRDLELIIIDDGSSDNSFSVAQTYVEKDPRVRLYTKVNSGIVDSLNLALDVSKGDIIARMDADDIATPDRIEKLLQCRAMTNADIVYSNISLIDKYGAKICTGFMPNKNIVLRLLESRNFIPHPSVLFLKSVITEAGGYTKRLPYSEDLDLWIRLRDAGKKFSFCNNVLLHYRINPNTSRKELYNRYWFDIARLCFLNKNRKAALRYLSKVSFYEKVKIVVKYFLPYSFHLRNLDFSETK
jgi:glycosyltransferase involved in cell wall biosynthesis